MLSFASASTLVAAIVAIVFGIIILIFPRVIAYLIGAYLIFIGIMFFVSC